MPCQDFSPARSLNGGVGRFFDFHEADLLAMDASDDESFYDSNRHLEDDGRCDWLGWVCTPVLRAQRHIFTLGYNSSLCMYGGMVPSAFSCFPLPACQSSTYIRSAKQFKSNARIH